MAYSRPSVLSIAGLDPSGGAGLLADIKTFEQQRCLGFGVASAVTVQTEDQFFGVDWLPLQTIYQQCSPLFDRYEIAVVKIGIMENIISLLQLVAWLKAKRKGVRIVWDPVIAASAGFHLLATSGQHELQELLQQLYLVTPNIREALLLCNAAQPQEAAADMARHCAVLLKGGHAEQEKGTDYLFWDGSKTALPPAQQRLPAKHGSGCILSAAIAAQLAYGHSLLRACSHAKSYIETVLNSNNHLLAYHYV